MMHYLATEAHITNILATRSIEQAERTIERAKASARKSFLVWLLYGGGIEELKAI